MFFVTGATGFDVDDADGDGAAPVQPTSARPKSAITIRIGITSTPSASWRP